MQNSVNITGNQRISPDITHISFTPTSVVPAVARCMPGSDNLGVNLNSNTISEVPPELYEFLVDDNGEAKILCKICQYISNKKSNFKRHFTNMHFVQEEDSAKVLECCGIRFSTKGEKFQHTKSVHKAGYKCSTCSKVFDRPALLQRHLAKHTGKKPYKCSLCTYQTPNKANAKRHIEKKHADVHEGSIMFVTEDGEQIQMEIVSKVGKDQERDRPSSSTPSAIVKSTADSTSFKNSPGLQTSTSSLSSSSCAATVTSSSFPSDKFLQGIPILCYKKRQISHSIDSILAKHSLNQLCPQHAEAVRKSFPGCESAKSATSTISQSFNQHSINETTMSNYYAANWSHTSSLFPNVCNLHPQLDPFPQHTCQDAYESNPGSAPLFFRQCAHGCWHVDNHNPSSVLQHFPSYQFDVSFATANFNRSQDSRSISSVSQTENSSIMSIKSEDDDTGIIDVVGDGDETETAGLPLSNICEGLGRFSTNEQRAQEEGESEMCIVSPPVESGFTRRSSCSGSSSTSISDKDAQLDSQEYVPKKLRVSRSFVK